MNLKKIPHNLQWLFERDLIQDYTSLDKLSNNFIKNGKAYVGFDATKPSLQLGNMTVLNIGELLIKKGITVYVVLGGATTLIGDPAGKDTEREIVSEKFVRKNVQDIKNYLKKYFPKFIIIDNISWWKNYKVIDFLRLSKSIGINYLLDRQFIRERLESTGISYTEFSYTMIQGIDFYHLAKEEGILMQFGGSDQWGNFLTGHDLIQKNLGIDASCFSTPLLVDNQNRKFGKTADNALFLDDKLTSNYDLYQNLINQPDDMIEKLLKKLTTLSLSKIEKIIQVHNQDKKKRKGQIAVAKEVITKTRGKEAFLAAKKTSELLFNNSFK